MQENHRYKGAETGAVELLTVWAPDPLPEGVAVTVDRVVPDGSVASKEHETSVDALRSYAFIAKLIDVDWDAAGTGQ